MMKEDKFFKKVPYPFRLEEEEKLKRRILSSLPEKKYIPFGKIALSFGIILIIISIPFFISNKKEVQVQKKVEVINPLKIKSEEIAFQNLPFPMPDLKEEKIEDIPFKIFKEDHSVKLVWEDKEAKKYRIKKCLFPPKDKGCDYVDETEKNYYLDKSLEESNLVIYIVEAIKG